MKRVHLLPNVITAFSLCCGLFVIFRMCMTNPGDVNLYLLTSTAGILLLAAVADVLDGAVARAMKMESEFGGLFDSLSDAITFGVGPSVVVLKSLSLHHNTPLSFFLMTAAMVYSVCGVLRLVRFNLISNQAKNDPVLADSSKKNFTGLPIPAAAMAVVSATLFLMTEEIQQASQVSDLTRTWLLIGALCLTGYFMISRWKFPSLKNLRIRVGSFRIVFLTVLSAIIVVYGILNHFGIVFFAISWLYILIAVILSVIRIISGHKSKTLEDFEPEPESEDES
jgi:CDP-diacylglycerol---serine O-phosphatidyltransferase